MILYVTSFNEHLYQATGKDMIKSFVMWKTEGNLLITYEDGVHEDIVKHRKFLFHNLDKDDFLHNWLKTNEDIIPVEYGGLFTGKFEDKFNRRAACWFRKIAAINAALKCGYDKIVFVDSDSVFKKQITEEYMDQIFDGGAMFYHLGKSRIERDMGIESGFIGWDLNNGGKEYLQHVIDSFTSGDFRKYRRWDDGYVFRMIVDEHPEIKTRDVVENLEFMNVVEPGPFGKFVKHNKGIHGRDFDI